VHNQVHILTIHPDLQVIVESWERLPEHIKTEIKALVNTHTGKVE